MSTLDHIEWNTCTIGSGDTSATATLGTTLSDTDKAFVIPAIRSGSNQPAQAHGRVNITSTTVVTATRNNSGDTLTWAGHVIEFEGGNTNCTVQRGTSLGTGSGEGDRSPDVDIDNGFDLTKAFLIWSFEEDGGTYGADDGVRAYLFDAGAGDLKIKFGDGGIGNNKVRDLEWQVVELNDCTVERDTGGTISMGTSIATTSDTITSVTLSRSFMTFSATWDNGTGANIGQKCLAGGFTSATVVDFSRDNTGVAINDIVYEVVQLSTDWTVQEITGAFGSADTTVSLTSGGGDFTALSNTANCFTISSYMSKGGNANYAGDDIPGESWFSAEVSSVDTITLTRQVGNSTADYRGFVLEWSASSPITVSMSAFDLTLTMVTPTPVPDPISTTPDPFDLTLTIAAVSVEHVLTPDAFDLTLTIAEATGVEGALTVAVDAFDLTLTMPEATPVIAGGAITVSMDAFDVTFNTATPTLLYEVPLGAFDLTFTPVAPQPAFTLTPDAFDLTLTIAEATGVEGELVLTVDAFDLTLTLPAVTPVNAGSSFVSPHTTIFVRRRLR